MGIKNRYELGLIPDNLIDYVNLVSQSDGIGKIPGAKLGNEIAIIGAGCAGLCAAYELMKIGVYLSGDTTSWAGGWVEGAFRSGLDAAMAIIKKLGGKVHSSENDQRFI